MEFPNWKKLLLQFQLIACLPASSLPHLPLCEYKLCDLMLSFTLSVRQLVEKGPKIYGVTQRGIMLV